MQQLAELGAPADGLILLERGVIAYRGLNTPPIFFPFLILLQAGAYRAAHRLAEATACLTQAIPLVAGDPPDKASYKQFQGWVGIRAFL